MMNITLESIDGLRGRANVGYSEAKEALVACEGDMLDAIIYLEDHYGIKTAKQPAKDITDKYIKEGKKQAGTLFSGLKKAIRYAFKTNVILENKHRRVIDLPLIIAAPVGLLFHIVTIMVVGIALMSDYKIRLDGNKGY